ncbi:MAG: hypothetical protein D6800_03545, partial [Candidatus Zixiibacteriota bacterium]
MNRICLLLCLGVSVFLYSCNKSNPTDSPSRPPQLGKLHITVTGLPSGLRANITVTGPQNFSQTVTAQKEVMLDSLPVGQYAATANFVIMNTADTIWAQVPTQTVQIKAGQTTDVTISYQALLFGSLGISITGLPAGETGYVRVYKSGESAYTEVNQTARLDSLLAGSYEVIAYGVVAKSGIAYIPDVDTQTVQVTAGSLTSVAVVYKEKYGRLQVNVTGLPSGETGSVRVYRSDWNPQDGEYFDVQRTVLLDSLLEGVYHIDAVDVAITTGEVYRPQHYFQQVTVVPGNTYVVDVPYSPKYGSLDVTINGLPFDVDAKVVVTSQANAGLSWTLTDSKVLDTLEEGVYHLQAYDVYSADGTWYKPDVYNWDITVDGGQTTYTTVTYKPPYGKIDVTVTGLPADVPADITVAGPSGETVFTYHTKLIDSLLEGDYDVIAREVTGADGTAYIAKPDSQRVTVVGGQTTNVTVKYTPKAGWLDLSITGLPSGLPARVIVEKVDHSLTMTVIESTVLGSLEPGDYTVLAKSVVDNAGDTLTPKPDSQLVTIVAGDTAHVQVVYEGGFVIRLLNGHMPGGG